MRNKKRSKARDSKGKNEEIEATSSDSEEYVSSESSNTSKSTLSSATVRHMPNATQKPHRSKMEPWELKIESALQGGDGLKPERLRRHTPTAKEALAPLAVEKKMGELIDKINDNSSMEKIKKDPLKLRRLFYDAEQCAKKAVELKMDGSENLLKAVQGAKEAYKDEIKTANDIAKENVQNKRGSFAKSHQKEAGKVPQHEESTPKFKK